VTIVTDLPDIRICISAYACDPTRGSEPGIGWNVVREMARRHRVWALTRQKNELAITAALQQEPLPNLQMVYFDVPSSLRFWKRGKPGIEAYYALWQRLTRKVLEDLHRQVRFDITQHVTFGRYWAPAALASVPVPFVWGPVGGGESAPVAFRRDLGLRGRASEFIRDRGRRLMEAAPSVRRAAREAAVSLAVTEETKVRLLAIGSTRVQLFSAMGMSRAAYDTLSAIRPVHRGPLRFISMGRLLDWKGFHLGLKAFAAAAVPDAEYWIVGDGPERASLLDLASRLRLGDRVRFRGALAWREALDTLAQCDVLVHPSLHDSGGFVCLEAMAVGKPVLCLDLGGPAEQVTHRTGVKVPANSPAQAVSDLAAAMAALGSDTNLRQAMGEEGRRRVREEYIWERKGARLEAIYASILRNSRAAAVPVP
jgi:glycosyltransferase involved in cell wall biosynthesis